jgi:hypothetical protein
MGKKSKQETLPGMERRDVPEIEQAAENYRKIRDERCELSKRESEAKSALIQVMKNKGRTYYSYNGLNVQLSNQENVKVKSKDEDDEEPIGRFTQASRREPKINTSPATEFIEETQAEEESNIAAAAECSCGHLAVDHEENGACRVIGEGGAACDCDGFAPPDENQERERLHREAVATWRRERPASIEYEDQAVREAKTFSEIRAEEDDGGTPFPTEYSEAEIERIKGFYCADKIAAGKPVKICYVLEEPHIITGYDSTSVTAWPVLPIENVGEDGVFEYKDAPEPFTYHSMKVNCGSAKKRDWWVMVGPEIKFYVDYSANYPNDEIEAAVDSEGAVADDFTAPRCDECKRTDGAHTKECSKNPMRLTPSDYLAYAQAHYKTNHQSHARKMSLTGMMDDQIRAWKQQQAGNGAATIPEGASPDPRILCWCKHKYADHREGTFCRKKGCGCNSFSWAGEPEPEKAKSAKLSPIEAAIDR